MSENVPFFHGDWSFIRKMALRQFFIINPLITLIIFVFFGVTGQPYLHEHLIKTLIVTQFEGMFIVVPILLIHRWIMTSSKLKILFTTIVIITVFGNLGSFASTVVFDLFGFNLMGRLWSVQMFVFNFGMAAIFGSAIMLYYYLLNRIEKQAIEIQVKETEKERISHLQRTSELQALRSRIDPHFLFNTLNSIASLIRSNPVQAEEMVEKLAGLFRDTLYAEDEDLVVIGRELELIRKYLAIEKVRLGDRLTYLIDYDQGVKEQKIPPLLFQPLVENSVKHGVSLIRKGGHIDIKISLNNNSIHFFISNEVPDDHTKNEDSGGFGLRSIRERLQLIYGDKAEMIINDGGEFTVEIIIPQNGI